MKKNRSSFRGKVGRDAQKSMRASRGYLNLPEGVKQYQVEEKTRKVLFDILPYIITDNNHPNKDVENEIAMKGDLWYRRPFKVHRNVGVEDETCVCPKSFGKPCPICEHQKKRFADGADKEETKLLYPKDRNLYVVVPIDQDKFEEEPHIWDVSQALFQDILKDALDEDPDNEVFPDLEEGKTLEVSFKWKTLGNNTFPEARNINFLKRDKPYKESILDAVPDLDTVLKVLSYEDLSNKFFEIDAEPDAGHIDDVDDTDEAPEPPKRERKERTATSRKPEKEEEKEDKLSWEDLQELSGRKLTRLCDEHKLKIDLDDVKYDDDDVLRKAIAEKMDIEMPRRSRKASEKVKEESDDDEKCPSGHKFGVDGDDFKECNSCDLWDECVEAKEKKK